MRLYKRRVVCASARTHRKDREVAIGMCHLSGCRVMAEKRRMRRKEGKREVHEREKPEKWPSGQNV